MNYVDADYCFDGYGFYFGKRTFARLLVQPEQYVNFRLPIVIVLGKR